MPVPVPVGHATDDPLVKVWAGLNRDNPSEEDLLIARERLANISEEDKAAIRASIEADPRAREMMVEAFDATVTSWYVAGSIAYFLISALTTLDDDDDHHHHHRRHRIRHRDGGKHGKPGNRSRRVEK